MNGVEAAEALGLEPFTVCRWAHTYLGVPLHTTEKASGLDLDDADLAALRIVRDLRPLLMSASLGRAVRRALSAQGEGQWMVLTAAEARWVRTPEEATSCLIEGPGCIVVRVS